MIYQVYLLAMTNLAATNVLVLRNLFCTINMLKTALLFVSERPLMLSTNITIYKEEKKSGHTEERIVSIPLNVNNGKASNVVNRKS
jgi:hypothetical protein